MDWRTPGYMVREEAQRSEKKAWKLEKKIQEGREEELATKCHEEVAGRGKRAVELTQCEKESFSEIEGQKKEKI